LQGTLKTATLGRKTKGKAKPKVTQTVVLKKPRKNCNRQKSGDYLAKIAQFV
jgi:hypothetical protein